jgi:mannan endo-1,4-beta-mannosidase
VIRHIACRHSYPGHFSHPTTPGIKFPVDPNGLLNPVPIPTYFDSHPTPMKPSPCSWLPDLFLHRVTVALISLATLLSQSCKDDQTIDPPPDIDVITFKVEGKYLKDPCGDKVILKGMNKMSVFDEEDAEGTNYFPEIAKTGANCVRIVWQQTYSNGTSSNLAQLDKLIQNCIDQKMIPIVEMHDATCNLAGVASVVNYWTSAGVLALVKKYEHAMLVNIANEAGDYTVTAEQWIATYKQAITKMRNAGINAPLIIDAPDCGKNLELIVPVAVQLSTHDPLKNIIFSAHPYWSKLAGATPAFIASQLGAANAEGIALILGEVAGYGGWPGENVDETKSCAEEGEVDYSSLLIEAGKHEYGWLLWEWGPGNGFYDHDPVVLCPAMDITSNGKYSSVESIMPGSANAWAKDAVITGSYSLKNSAAKTGYITNGFTCAN